MVSLTTTTGCQPRGLTASLAAYFSFLKRVPPQGQATPTITHLLILLTVVMIMFLFILVYFAVIHNFS